LVLEDALAHTHAIELLHEIVIVGTHIHVAGQELYEKDLRDESMFVFANVPDYTHVTYVHCACDREISRR
jgi:hypothetical protein